MFRNYELHDILFLKLFKHLVSTAKQHPRIEVLVCPIATWTIQDYPRTQGRSLLEHLMKEIPSLNELIRFCK